MFTKCASSLQIQASSSSDIRFLLRLRVCVYLLSKLCALSHVIKTRDSVHELFLRLKHMFTLFFLLSFSDVELVVLKWLFYSFVSA